MSRHILSLIIGMLVSMSAWSQDMALKDTDVKARTDAISKTLRCVVCQNQSIYESNAPLAADMRRLVEERVRAGDTDEEVREYLRGPYGDFILMKPPLQRSTLLLWLGPVLFVFAVMLWFLRQRKSAVALPPCAITELDRTRLDAALKGLSNEDQS